MDDSLRKREREAAREVADRAKLIAARFSRRIPASTFVREYSDHVEIITSGKGAPNAAAFEKPQDHPLFGNYRHMYRQPHRPYMEDALRDKGDSATDHIGNVVDDWGEEFGYEAE